MTPSLVSIVIPAYNVEHCVSRCLSSLAQQTYPSLEIIIVDDGSRDGTRALLAQWATREPRIEIVDAMHVGVSAARNLALARCSGEFVTFVDADDWLTPNAIESWVKAATRLDVDCLIAGYFRCPPDAAPTHYIPVVCRENTTSFSHSELLSYLESYAYQPNRYPLFVTCWGRLFRHDFLEKNGIVFNESLSTFEDVELNFRTLLAGARIGYLPDCHYHYSENPQQLSASHSAVEGAEKLLGFRVALDVLETLFVAWGVSSAEASRRVDHAKSAYFSITLVRLCRQMIPANESGIVAFIDRCVRAGDFRRQLKHYDVKRAGGSVLLAWLMRLRWSRMLALAARHRAIRRYGKLNPQAARQPGLALQ